MRVIGGAFGGRRIRAPRGRGTRPTSDRVREALFMMLEPLTGRRVVDLYAGSGALGIEALSRGAARADFCESDRAARTVLERNLEALGLSDQATIWRDPLPRGLKRMAGVLAAAELVLVDPPYGGQEARAVLEALGAEGTLKPGATVVVEHHAKDELPARSGCLARARQRRHGETVVSTYRVSPASAPRPI